MGDQPSAQHRELGSDVLEVVVPQAVQALEGLLAATARWRGEDADHRVLGRVVRDVVVAEIAESLGPWRAARTEGDRLRMPAAAQEALRRLLALQSPRGTFRSGDNLDSPPDSAFTINDLAWSLEVLRRRESDASLPHAAGVLLPPLERVLGRAVPALVTGGVHTPNHRWELSAALARLGALLDDPRCTERAEEWLGEGIDLQPDGLFSERSPNYAARVSIPSLLVLGRAMGRSDLVAVADRATIAQAGLTSREGMVETIGSRRQDQHGLFDGAAMYPLLRAHAARHRDALTARAAKRTVPRVDSDSALELLAMGIDDPEVLGALPAAHAEPGPDRPEIDHFSDSGVVIIDHGVSRAVLHGSTDVVGLGRITSGSASHPAFLRFAGHEVRMDDLRLSRDFFSLGPVRFDRPELLPPEGPPGRLAAGGVVDVSLRERVAGEYYLPLPASSRRADGAYEMQFNGRFASAMDFASRARREVAMVTAASVRTGPGMVAVDLTFDGPDVPVCLAMAFDGGRLSGVEPDAEGRLVPVDQRDGIALWSCRGVEERIDVRVTGAVDGGAFYAPGEMFTVLGATDEPQGDVVHVRATSSGTLRVELALSRI